MSRFLIYALTCPRCGAVRYVGKSTTGMVRTRQHLTPSMLAQRCYRTRWLRSLLAGGLKPGVTILEELVAVDGLAAAEVRWIAHGRAAGWPLTNGTDGGDGTPGSVRSPESRARMSAALSGRKKPHLAAQNRARAWSPEMRAKVSRARRENTSNKPNAKPIRMGLVTRSITDWARAAGIHPPRFRDRVRKLHWPIERAIGIRTGS